MLSADHPFKLPVDPTILSDLRKLFEDAAAKHPPLAFTSITSIKPWPLIRVNVPELLDAMVQYMGKGERLCIRAHDSPSMGPPYELFLAQQDALDCYKELARRVGEQTPLGPYKDWTYTLHQLAWTPDVVSFRAPEKRIHGYPRGQGQGWLWTEEHQAPEYWHPVAVVCYWQLADLWTASAEALDVWNKQRAGHGNVQMRAELALQPNPQKDVAHSDDFRSVRWFGTDYIFTATQAACVQVLWEAWEKGVSAMSQTAILDLAGSTTDRLISVFGKGKHPAWDSMIVCANKGSYRLNPPS